MESTMKSPSFIPAADYTSVLVSVAKVLDSNCRFLYEKWDSLCGSDFAPSLKEIDLPRLPSNIIPFIRVVDVSHAPFDLTYRFWGTGLANRLGSKRTGTSLADLPGGQGIRYTLT